MPRERDPWDQGGSDRLMQPARSQGMWAAPAPAAPHPTSAEAGGGRPGVPPRASGGSDAADTFTSDSRLQNRERIHFCCLKPPGVGPVSGAPGTGSWWRPPLLPTTALQSPGAPSGYRQWGFPLGREASGCGEVSSDEPQEAWIAAGGESREGMHDLCTPTPTGGRAVPVQLPLAPTQPAIVRLSTLSFLPLTPTFPDPATPPIPPTPSPLCPMLHRHDFSQASVGEATAFPLFLLGLKPAPKPSYLSFWVSRA